MLLVLAASSAILSGIFPLHWPGHDKVRVAGWTYEVDQDPFTYLKSCRLYRRGVTYTHETLTFHLPPWIDTSEAIYRIDNAAAQPWRASATELAAKGVTLQRDDLRNPSGSVVPIPARQLVDANVVTIRPSQTGSLVQFRVDGFSRAITAARSAGCTPDGFR